MSVVSFRALVLLLILLVTFAVSKLLIFYASKNPETPKSRLLLNLGRNWIYIVGLVAFIFSPLILEFGIGKKIETNDRIANNLDLIQCGLWEYSEKHEGQYPLFIEDLLFENLCSGIPENVLTHEPMKPVEFGSPDFAGNFTYIPVIEEDKIPGYYLIGYGDAQTQGKDINADGVPDHVILVISDMGRDVNVPVELLSQTSAVQPEI